MRKCAALIIIFSVLLSTAEMAAGAQASALPTAAIDAPVFHLIALFRVDLTVMRGIITGDIPLAPVFTGREQCRRNGNDPAISGPFSPRLQKPSPSISSLRGGGEENNAAVPCILKPDLRRTIGPPQGGIAGINSYLLSYLVSLSLGNLPGEIPLLLPYSPAAQTRIRAFSFSGGCPV